MSAINADIASGVKSYQSNAVPVVDPDNDMSVNRLLSELEAKRVVFVSETHDRYDHHPMVILAGSGHVAYADAIPGRLTRMVGAEHAVVVTGSEERYAGGAVDFLFAQRDIALEPPGRMGLMLASGEEGVTVREVRPKSPAEQAGFQPGDRIIGISGEPIQGMDDVRLALLDRTPGEAVWVEFDSAGKSKSDASQGRALTLL